MKTLVEEFAWFLNTTQYEDIPKTVVTLAKNNILDFVGVAIGGFSMEFSKIWLTYIGSMGGKKESTLIYPKSHLKVPAMNAALGNAVCGHTLDMDGGHRYGGGHTGVTVIPAAIAAGESKELDGKALILSVVLGVEIICRIGKAVDPSHLKRGFHRTSTLGPFGAAAAAGKLYGLDEQELTMALGFAGLQSAGLLEVLHEGAMAKPLQPGKAAMAGIISSELAAKGAKSPKTILEGEKGFFKAMADEINTDELLKDLGRHYYIQDQYFKLHASCRHTHPAIDAVLQLKKDHQLNYWNVTEIKISTYPVAVNFAGTPHVPKDIEGAKFSMPFSVALALFFGDVNVDRHCMETLNDSNIQKLSSAIHVMADKKWEKLYPKKRGATVKILCKNGEEFSTDVALAKGEPENQVTTEELIDKFKLNTSKMPKPVCDRLINIILELDKHKISDFTKYFIV